MYKNKALPAKWINNYGVFPFCFPLKLLSSSSRHVWLRRAWTQDRTAAPSYFEYEVPDPHSTRLDRRSGCTTKILKDAHDLLFLQSMMSQAHVAKTSQLPSLRSWKLTGGCWNTNYFPLPSTCVILFQRVFRAPPDLSCSRNQGMTL